jgi:hypothetical protein
VFESELFARQGPTLMPRRPRDVSNGGWRHAISTNEHSLQMQAGCCASSRRASLNGSGTRTPGYVSSVRQQCKPSRRGCCRTFSPGSTLPLEHEIRLPPCASAGRHPLRQIISCTCAQRYRKTLSGFDEGARRALQSYHWPGNVRELDHAAERSVLMAQGTVIRAETWVEAGSGHPRPRGRYDTREVEGLLVQKALTRFEGNVSRAAEALGLSRGAPIAGEIKL